MASGSSAAPLDSSSSAKDGNRSSPWEFSAFEPDRDGARRWRETTRFVNGLLADPEATAAPLVIGQAARLLAATALAIFPNTPLTGTASSDRRDACPETVRRAVSFIEAHASQDITVTDIAVAAFVTRRAVQLAFRRHLDTTPMAYLRRVRLENAHRDLQAADPARETVTAIAYRWGFSASRFAARYRQAYGLPPSRTLHR
jgi:transcriptional regulator GlxA family with amidase domain